MSLSCTGIIGVLSDPVIPRKPAIGAAGVYYSLAIASPDASKRDDTGKARLHRYTLKVWVSKDEQSLFIAQCTRGQVYFLKYGTLQETNETIEILTSYKHLVHLERQPWPNPITAKESPSS